MSHDFYQLLGVEPAASEKEIRSAFRDMARRCHPDRFATQAEVYRELAEVRMAELNEAYAVLTNAPRRKLYDECKRQGKSFRYVEMNSQPESRAEQAAREAHQEDLTERRTLAGQKLHQAILQLDPAVRWQEVGDEYFDKILTGRRGRSRLSLYLKVLPRLDPEVLAGITQYSRAVLQNTEASLLRSECVYLLVAQSVVRGAQVEQAVTEHNFACWALPAGLAPRSHIAWIDGKTGKGKAPEVEGAWPDVPALAASLRLDQIL